MCLHSESRMRTHAPESAPVKTRDVDTRDEQETEQSKDQEENGGCQLVGGERLPSSPA